MKNHFIYEKFSVVVPSYNEAKRVGKVIEEILKIKEVGELILVDDGSVDNTKIKIQKYKADPRFIYIRHSRNKGKGQALKTGVERAKNEVIQFLDADLMNITHDKIRKIALPVLKDEVDVSRGAFTRRRGRVTEYAVKPMMAILFPNMYFSQPISGQICSKKEFLKTVDFESRYGVDIGILFDAIESGQRIIEVNIGKLKHKANTEEVIRDMSKQVLETMIKKAGLIRHKYKLVIFTLDDTLIPKNSLDHIFKKLKIYDEIQKNQQLLKQGKIELKTFLIRNALLFKDKKFSDIESICNKVKLVKYAKEVISALKKRRYNVGIISSNFYPVGGSIAKRLGADYIDCVGLEIDRGILTGKITIPSQNRWFNNNLEDSYTKAFFNIVRKAKAKPSETIMVANTARAIPLMKLAGFRLAYKPKEQELKEVADKIISLHAEILALIE